MAPDKKILIAKGISPQSNQNKKVTSSTAIKHGDPWEKTISGVDIMLTSRADSLVVRKPNVSSFRDVELASVYRVYRACIWGGKCEANHAKSVQESLSAA